MASDNNLKVVDDRASFEIDDIGSKIDAMGGKKKKRRSGRLSRLSDLESPEMMPTGSGEGIIDESKDILSSRPPISFESSKKDVPVKIKTDDSPKKSSDKKKRPLFSSFKKRLRRNVPAKTEKVNLDNDVAPEVSSTQSLPKSKKQKRIEKRAEKRRKRRRKRLRKRLIPCQ